MTIEDNIQNHIDRMSLLDGFLRLAHLGRRTKESAVARKVRRNLIAEIEEMIDYEQDMLSIDRTYLKNTTEAERAADSKAGPDFFADDDVFVEVFELVPLLDAVQIISADRIYDLSTRAYFIVEEGYPVYIPVANEELGGVATLIERMTRDLGVTFTIERILRTEDELFAYSISREERERVAAEAAST